MANAFKQPLDSLAKDLDSGSYGMPFVLHFPLVAASANVDVFSKNAPFAFRVVSAWTVMNGAGAAGDKVKLQRGDGASSETFADITDDLDVSAKADKAYTAFTSLDDAQWKIARNESLRIVSTSGALADVYILCVAV